MNASWALEALPASIRVLDICSSGTNGSQASDADGPLALLAKFAAGKNTRLERYPSHLGANFVSQGIREGRVRFGILMMLLSIDVENEETCMLKSGENLGKEEQDVGEEELVFSGNN